MDDLTKEFRDRIGAAYKENSRVVWISTRWVRIGLVLLGSLLAGAFALFSAGISWPLTVPQFGGLVGGLMAFAGGAFISVTDKDTSEILDEARRAVDWASDQESSNSEMLDLLYQYEDAMEQLQSLYTALSLARGAIERAVFQNKTDEVALIQTCLETTKWNLRIALNFGLNEIWTICVYRAENGSDGMDLRLLAHNRSVDCEITNARIWPAGVGVGGVAYSKNDEVVVPNLDDPAVGTAFRLDKSLKKPEDRERYKSVFAVPIQIGSDDLPWGVVLATNNVPDHFGSSENDGVDPEEGVRALAGVVALAVAVCRRNHNHNHEQCPEDSTNG